MWADRRLPPDHPRHLPLVPLSDLPSRASSPLHRLYRIKFVLVAAVSTVAGVALIALAHWAAVQPTGTRQATETERICPDLPITPTRRQYKPN